MIPDKRTVQQRGTEWELVPTDPNGWIASLKTGNGEPPKTTADGLSQEARSGPDGTLSLTQPETGLSARVAQAQ
jgi:hypothetical protein